MLFQIIKYIRGSKIPFKGAFILCTSEKSFKWYLKDNKTSNISCKFTNYFIPQI